MCPNVCSNLSSSPNKTKYMIFSVSPSQRSVKGVTINGVTYEGVAEVIYLGTLISNDNSMDKEIQKHILAGNRTYFAAIVSSGVDFYPELPKFYYIRH